MSPLPSPHFPPELDEFCQALRRHRWRGLVWLQGEAGRCRERAWRLWGDARWQAPLWVAPESPDGIAASSWLPASKARTRLGGEQDLIVFDAASPGAGFDPEAFGALSGTLRAGGLMVLLTPTDWGARPDADYARLAEYPWSLEELSCRYLARLSTLLADAPGVARWTDAASPVVPVLTDEPREAPTSPDAACLTPDQADAVARLERLRRRRPLVMTADRGRGKTAALGIACARLLARGIAVLVTAPRPAAVAGLFERLAALCPEGVRQGNRFATDKGHVSFLAPDELQARIERGEAGGAGSWLLVDEAAAIPAGLLGSWLEAFPRIAFATTVHGYEGAGRGFALRFRERLDRLAPDWRECHLATPVRWAEGDPLEALTSCLLMLDAEPDVDQPEAGVHWQREDRRDLALDEPRLRAIFGLLVQAHYRTTPGDLRRLLDAPGGRIASLSGGGGVAAVAVTSDEGGFEPVLAERVARGERRPRGHLLAQSLAAHAGEREALMARLRRVLRIAVVSPCRRQGMGAQLLAAERRDAESDGIDLLGASFGAEPGLLAFWQGQGFRVVRLGLTRETSTGEHALMVVQPISAKGEALATRLMHRFHRQLPALLAFELAELEPLVALALLGECPAGPLSAEDLRDLEDVAHGHRDPAMVRPAVQALIGFVAPHGQGDDALAMLAAWAFQGRSDEWLARRLSLSGARQVDGWRRQGIARWLDAASLPKGEDGR
ncbi:tRNA(Met) cytidine acetyltransferase TmcA [Halomonas caseinilytica]|uniref:tRNA(Met) cytidine acetyltransferase TmcA n=1 Tax=Halomonas caseinilytica TaxID=438744 RepID=UPI0007E5435B|nr:GNAT family N-acetyltransferase [Halomonas caseinilytica]SEN12587.1 tRNA(Met) cytidine acetyltransferase [Halomonas caseinilytica]